MDLNYRESDEEVVKIEPNSSFTDGQDMTFGLGLDQAPFGSQLPQSLPPQHLLPQSMATPAGTTPQSAKKVSGRVERAARIAELFDAGSPRVRLDHFVYKVDDNPVFDAARVFLDGECQNLVYCCDPKCAEKPTFKRFFSAFKRGPGTLSSKRLYLHKFTMLTHHSRNHHERNSPGYSGAWYTPILASQAKNAQQQQQQLQQLHAAQAAQHLSLPGVPGMAQSLPGVSGLSLPAQLGQQALPKPPKQPKQKKTPVSGARSIQNQEFIAICADIMTKVSKHELPGDFWSSDEMFEFVHGLVERQQRGEAVTQIVIEEALEKLMTRHEFKDQNMLAIEDGMAPPTKRMKVATDEDIRNLVHIWETQPMRISLEDSIFPIDDYSQFSISRVRLDGECLGLMRCNHPLCCEKPLADRLHKIWFSSRTGQPHKYSIRRHHEQCHFGKSVSRATVIDAAALVISDTQLPLDSWAKPSLKHFISSVGQSSTFNKSTISVDEIVAAMRKANRPLSEAHRAELIAAGKAVLIYETDPNRAEVKPEPSDRAGDDDGIQIEEIEGGMDDSMGEDMPLSEILNQQPKPPALTAPPSSIASGAAGGSLLAAPGGGGGGGASAPSSLNPSVPGGLPKGASGTASGLNVSAASGGISAAAKLPDGDPPGVDSDDDDLDDEEEEMEADSDIPIESEKVQYPGKCTDLFEIYERWSPILSKEAKEKLVDDFSLNDPLYQKPEDIEDPELRMTIRDEWITVFPHWLANFKPLNAKDDGFQRIPLSDILAMRRMYRTELQARRTAPAK